LTAYLYKKIMSTRTETRTLYYVIAAAVVVIAFLLLGGIPWMNGMRHVNGSMGMTSLRWGQIMIGMGLGFLLGWVASRRRW
jgi:hypothetical protein